MLDPSFPELKFSFVGIHLRPVLVPAKKVRHSNEKNEEISFDLYCLHPEYHFPHETQHRSLSELETVIFFHLVSSGGEIHRQPRFL